MGALLTCDRCRHKEHLRLPIHYNTFHSVSPGNNFENDRLLCQDCYEIYQSLRKVSIVSGLLGWIDDQMTIDHHEREAKDEFPT